MIKNKTKIYVFKKKFLTLDINRRTKQKIEENIDPVYRSNDIGRSAVRKCRPLRLPRKTSNRRDYRSVRRRVRLRSVSTGGGGCKPHARRTRHAAAAGSPRARPIARLPRHRAVKFPPTGVHARDNNIAMGKMSYLESDGRYNIPNDKSPRNHHVVHAYIIYKPYIFH